MDAIVCSSYGTPDVLQFKQIPTPTPKDSEVLIRVHASSATTADSMMRTGTPYFARLFVGLFKPKHATPGTGLAGEVVAVGKDVTRFAVGDQVFGMTGLSFGANAEYACVDECGVLVIKPDFMTYEEAAPICDGALTSMTFLKEIAHIKPGQSLLVIGASGSLGTAAVQLGKHFGAQVTGVCSTRNQELVRTLGADQVIDYTHTEVTRTNQTYDIIYDTVDQLSFSRCKHLLTKRGRYLTPVLGGSVLLQMMLTSFSSGKKASFCATGVRPIPEQVKLLQEIKALFDCGQLTSVIDRCYPLSQLEQAHRLIDTGHKQGNVVMTAG